jgi:hypothetical protein
MNTYLASPPKDSLLRLLHSDLGRADLIDSVLATGRPLNYSRGCKHSFLTDEAVVFHVNTENRAATSQDPILQ